MPTHYDINWLIEKLESGEKLKYIFFWGDTSPSNGEIGKSCLSQWFESPFTVDGITYTTSEHWMMAHKALLFGDQHIFDQIINSKKPGEAKELGRQVRNFDEQTWNEHKQDIVRLGNIHKFNQHPQLADYLLKTGNRILVEASPIDPIWGIGLAEDDKDIENIYAWRGQNLLGFALMATRDFLKDFGHFNPLQSYPEQNINKQSPTPFSQTYFHGTKADLKPGDFIAVGYNSNYGQQKNAKYIFLTATLDAAIWGAELAYGNGRERIYLVEPTGEIEDDPDLTDRKFPGNPTKSYRSTQPFVVVGEVTVWQGHPAEQVKTMKEHLEKLKDQGINSLND